MSTKQEWLPGQKPERIAALMDAATTVLDGLIVEMHKRGLTSYQFGGLFVTLDTKEKVKVEGAEAEPEKPAGGVESVTVSSGEKSVTITPESARRMDRTIGRAIRRKGGID